MSITTRSELISAIGRWAWRSGAEGETDDDNFVAATPDFIALFESRANRELRVGEMLKTAPIAFTSGSATLPADYLQYRRVTEDAFSNASLNYGNEGYGRGFSISGQTIKGWPSTIGPLTMEYYAKIPPLTTTNTMNWLLAKAPELYLYGSLLEAMPFIGDDTRAGTWHAYYEKALEGLQSSDVLARYAKAGRRTAGFAP